MPEPERLLTTIRRAIQAFRATPGRRGRVVALEDVDEVLASGDLHGNVENFRLLLLKADLGKQPRRHLVVQELIHGPIHYAAGGDKSHQLLDLLAALKCQHPRQVHMLLGNHELSQGTNRRIVKGDLDLNQLFRQGVSTAYGTRADEVYSAYEELFAVVPLALRTPNRVFMSHSLPSATRSATFSLAALERDETLPSDLLPAGAVHSLVWGRDTSPANVTAFLQSVDADLLISGHIPCERGFEAPNDRQLILDSLGAPACYCLFPTTSPVSHADLVARVATL